MEEYNYWRSSEMDSRKKTNITHKLDVNAIINVNIGGAPAGRYEHRRNMR